MGSWDRFFKKAFSKGEEIDPLTHKALKAVVKMDSKGVREIAHGLGWNGLEEEADKNVNDPARGIGRAAATVGLLYGGAAALGAGGAGGGAGAAGLGAAEGGAGAAGGTAALGEVSSTGGLAGMGAASGVEGAPVAAAGEAGTMSGAGGAPSWSRWLPKSMPNMGGGGGGGGNNALLRQMRMAELMRQGQQYSQAHERSMYDE